MRRGSQLLLIAVIATAFGASVAAAQERIPRGAGGGGGKDRPVIAPNPKFPFVGSWVGTMKVGPGHPVMFEFIVDNGQYSGVTVFPNDAVAPHAKTKLVGDELHWEMKNSGTGIWFYKAKRPAADTLTGTVTLEGAVGLEGLPTTGTFTLVRKR